MNDITFKIVEYVVLALVLVIARYFIPYIALKLKNTKYANLLAYIAKAINAAESDPLFNDIVKAGLKKKDYVINAVTNYMNEHHIKITADQLNILIQGIFNEFNGKTVNVNK